jgi:hypothetical protein
MAASPLTVGTGKDLLTFNRQSADPHRQGGPTVDTQPVIDLGRAAELALARMLEAGRIVGCDGDGRRVVQVAVDDWVIDWFGPPPRRRSNRLAQAPAKPRPDHSSSR